MDIQHQLQKAQQAVWDGDYNQAAELYEQVLYEEPKELEALRGIVRISLATEQIEYALKFVEHILSEHPEDTEALLLRALCRERTGEMAAALEDALAAAQQAPDDALARYHYARLLAQDDQPHQALEEALVAKEVAPDDTDILLLLGRIYRDLGASKEAVQSFQEVIERVPQEITAYIELSEVLLQEGEIPMALEVLQNARDFTGRDIPVLHREMTIAAGQGDWQRALRKAEQLTKRLPDAAQAWITYGLLLLMQKDISRAEKAFLEAREAEPTAWQPEFHLGEVYYAGGLLDKAISCFQAAMQKDPQAWSPRNNLALLLLAEDPKATADALALLKEAVSLAPDEPAPLLNLGLACLKAGDAASARRCATLLLGGGFSLEADLREQAERLAQEVG